MAKQKKGIEALVDGIDQPAKVSAKRAPAKKVQVVEVHFSDEQLNEVKKSVINEVAEKLAIDSDFIEGNIAAVEAVLNPTTAEPKLILVPASDLWPSEMNPRKHFDEESLLELSNSIKEQGMLQPVVARKKPGQLIPDPKVRQLYEVICGARRSRAAEMIGPDFMVPVIVRELTDDQAFDLMITENLQRQDINVMEEARAFKALHDRGMTQQQIADRFGKSHVFVWQCIELNKCIEPVQKLIEDGVMNKRIALAISKYDTDDQQEWFSAHGDDLATATEKGVKFSLQRSVERSFDRAHFIPGDTQFAPVHDARIECASCVSCAFNTANPESENYDAAEDAMCIRRKCFDAKNELYTERVLQLLPEGFPVLLGYLKKAEHYPFVNLKSKKLVLNDDWGSVWVESLSEYGVPVLLDEPNQVEVPDLNDYAGPDDQNYLDALEEYEQEMAEYEKDMAAYLDSQKSYSMAFWYWLENGAQTKELGTNRHLGFDIGNCEFKLFRYVGKKPTTIDAVIAENNAASTPTVDPADIKKKIARNEALVEEKLYDALTNEITGLATYGQLNHLDPQPPLTDAEWLLLYANIFGYTTKSDVTDQVRKALKMPDGHYTDISDEQLVKVMHNIGPWIIRRHLMSAYHPAQGSNAFKNLGRWNAVAASHPDIPVVDIRAEIAVTYEKRNDKLRAQLAELEGVES